MCEDASEGGRSAQDDASTQARCGSPVSDFEFRRQLEKEIDGPITRGMLKRAIDEAKYQGSGRHPAVERTEADVGDLANHLARSTPPEKGRRRAVEDIDRDLTVHELDYDESQLWGPGRRKGRNQRRKQTGNYQPVAPTREGTRQ